MMTKNHKLTSTVSVFIFHHSSLISSLIILNNLSSREIENRIVDLCYNVRHFELHGRDLEDLWSCRQSAIHQKYYFANERSNWILVQSSNLFSIALNDFDLDYATYSTGLHVRYLVTAIANWRPYLNYIAEKLAELIIKLFFKSLLASK